MKRIEVIEIQPGQAGRACSLMPAFESNAPVQPTRPACVVAVVLAAGGSVRMGRPKQLLDWRGKPLLRHALDQVCAARLGKTDPLHPRVIVVLGSQAEQIRAALTESGDMPHNVHIVVNPDWSGGLSTSLRAGLAAVPDEAEAALFVQADQPNLTPQLLEALAARFEATRAPIVIPVCQGQRGTPVLFARSLFGELAAVQGDQGGRTIIRTYANQVAEVTLSDPAILADIDTPEDYQRFSKHKGTL